MTGTLRAGSRILAVTLALTAAAAPAQENRHAVQSLHYGDALFYYYQQKYFTSATRLDASKMLDRLSPHDDEARLLTGGLYLSYGLHQEAGRLFEQMIEAGVPAAVRGRAWFYLAKVRYQRGYPEEAEAALARIESSLPAELDDERHVLQAILLMERGRAREAVWKLDSVAPRSDWAAYGNYNLGVALIRAGDRERGIALLDKVGHTPQVTDELQSLKDKANVALGYAFLQDNQPAQTRLYLERVRLSGLHANKALLGMGWAYSAEENHERSLVMWDQLQQRDMLDSAVQEAMIATPYALGMLGVYSESLKRYETAAAAFGNELARLDQSIDSIRAGRLVEAIERENTRDELGWFWYAKNLPDSPETRYLAQMVAGHSFQEALKNHHDLGFLAANLAGWRRQLEAFGDMLDNRRRAHAERLARMPGWDPEHTLANLKAEQLALSGLIGRIESEGNALALAHAGEQKHLDRLYAIGARLAAGPGQGIESEAAEKIRILKGVLVWDVSSQYHARLWEIKKNLAGIEQALTEAGERKRRLAGAPAVVTQTSEVHGRKITEARTRLTGLEKKIQALRQQQARFIETLAVAELDRHKQRLGTYLTQARFAIAQIYDQASRQGDPP